MSNRLAFWEAQAYSRMVAGADEIEVPKLAPTLVVVNKSGANRRTIVDGFKSKVAEAGRDITRKDIWTVAGYSDRTEFERFQRGEARATQSAINSFNRVLNMKPEEFIRDLEKKTAK